MRLGVVLRSERGGWERSAHVVDLHLAGAGVETDEPLTAGERVTIAFATPTLWDPLVLSAVVAWAHPLGSTDEVDALGRPRTRARAGLAFDYPTPDATLAMFEMLVAIGFE
ncbi:MAG: PilZ domain-containing protein [Labilithrix sp.]|nr:PilZ domain-containing protein [Labilithrix sp.]